MKTSETIKQISKSMVAAIGELKPIGKDSKNPFLKNKYASLDAIIEGSKPILLKHGLCFFQAVSECGVETVIMHESGEWLSSDCMRIPDEQSKGLSVAQSRGVAITYCKRYQLGAMLGISTDEDTDGQYGDNSQTKDQPKDNKPVNILTVNVKPWITDEQVRKVLFRIESGEIEAGKKAFEAFRMSKENKSAIEQAMKFEETLTLTHYGSTKNL